MKRFFGLIMCLVLLAGAVSPVWAQRSRGQYRRYDNSRQVYYDQRYNNRSIWDQHRDKITVAAGAGVGALIGGLTGGRTGAAIGALIGAGGSALYTYRLRDSNNRGYYRRR
jgi:hypothetical protein